LRSLFAEQVCLECSVFPVISMPFCFAQEMVLSYDANGNLVTGDGKYRVYNSLNQLYRVYNGSGTNGTLLYEFKYHPLEERVLVKKTYNSSGSLVETVYYWSQNFITVVNASGSYNYTYVYHNGDLVAQQNPDGSKLFVLGDNKGSTSVITNSSGSVLERTTYSPFGEVLSGGRLNRYGYEGKEQEMGFGEIPTDGLVSYYALEGGAYDDGVGNQGVVANATLTTGKIRDAYRFDGYADYVIVNDSGSLDLTGSITLSAWVNPVEATQGYIVCKYGAYMIQFRGDSSNTTQAGIWVGGSWITLATSSAIPYNTWSHVVFTYNQSRARIYINGVLTGSGTNTSSIDTNNNPFIIGARNSTYRSRDFNGSIDEVGIWNRALTQDEVTQLYNYGASFDSGFRSTDFEARRYNSNTGLFEQPDELVQNGYNPQALNHYMFQGGNPYRYIDPSGRNYVEYRVKDSKWSHRVVIIYNDEAGYAHLYSWGYDDKLIKGFAAEPDFIHFEANSEKEMIKNYGHRLVERKGTRHITSQKTDKLGIEYANTLAETHKFGALGFSSSDKYFNCWTYDKALMEYMDEQENEQLWEGIYSQIKKPLDEELLMQQNRPPIIQQILYGFFGSGGSGRDSRLPWAVQGDDGKWYPPDSAPTPIPEP